MDHLSDFLSFKRLVMRLCTTFDKFANDELIETWWKVLKDQPFKSVESRVDAYIARADEKTKFPKPAQFRADSYVSDVDRARYDFCTQKSIKYWRSFIADHPTTGPIRLKLAQAAQLMAKEHEGSTAYSEAEYEYRALEKQLGGRFARDF